VIFTQDLAWLLKEQVVELQLMSTKQRHWSQRHR
jgi:hypothetical protein